MKKDEKVEKTLGKSWKKVAKKLKKVDKKVHFSDWNKFEIICLKKIIQVTDSIPWVRCASGNVYINV